MKAKVGRFKQPSTLAFLRSFSRSNPRLTISAPLIGLNLDFLEALLQILASGDFRVAAITTSAMEKLRLG
jgi:hypothetical protein